MVGMEHPSLAPVLFDLSEYGIEITAVSALMQKIVRKEKLSRDDKRLLAKIEKAYQLHYGESYLRSLPKKRWCELAGRQPKVVNEQSVRYGLSSLGNATVDLTKLPRELHELLAAIAGKWNDLDDEMGAPSPWLEKCREMRAKQEKLVLLKMRNELLPKDFVASFFSRIASQIRDSSFKLEKRFGADAKLILENSIDTIIKDYHNSLTEK